MIAVLLLVIAAVLLFGAAAVKNAIAMIAAVIALAIAVLVLSGVNWWAVAQSLLVLGALGAVAVWLARRDRLDRRWAELLRGEWGGGPVPEKDVDALRQVYEEHGFLAAIEQHTGKRVA